ncbi:Fur-regulated basic protein FbpA [Bacillaceae bacterium C204]|uniref:Fur-regulated basic protein FbpA n=1 Tax=Neobacillus sp. 204 TaxID=3383351 RepID=UPI00397CC8FB
MATHLRKGLERLRKFYIKKLLETGATDSSVHELHSLTFSELESLYNKTFSPAKS